MQLVEVVCPVDGTVVRVEAGVGLGVDRRTPVVTVDASGMTVTVEAGVTGIIEEMRAEIGAVVEPGEVLVVVRAPADEIFAGEEEDEVIDSVLDESPAIVPVCRHCGSEVLEPGFVEDRGQGAGGFGRWVEGHLQFGLLGGARVFGRRRRAIEAYRCVRCAHLVLFATDEV
jgi:hypothetical protein